MSGPLQSIEFLDRNALFWHTSHVYRAVTKVEISSISTLSTGKEDIMFKADSHIDGANEGLRYGLCLGL